MPKYFFDTDAFGAVFADLLPNLAAGLPYRIERSGRAPNVAGVYAYMERSAFGLWCATYVGQSEDVPRRVCEHNRDHHWVDRTTLLLVLPHDGPDWWRLADEARLIASLNPLYNVKVPETAEDTPGIGVIGALRYLF